MILIATVDDRNGLTFNGRRQSEDRVLREKILSLTKGRHLWMDNYTAKQFDVPLAPQIVVNDNYMTKAAPGDYCFLERLPFSFCKGVIDEVILFRWNRRYPWDVCFPVTLEPPKWQLTSIEEFPGYSHEKITMEVWKREKDN